MPLSQLAAIYLTPEAVPGVIQTPADAEDYLQAESVTLTPTEQLITRDEIVRPYTEGVEMAAPVSFHLGLSLECEVKHDYHRTLEIHHVLLSCGYEYDPVGQTYRMSRNPNAAGNLYTLTAHLPEREGGFLAQAYGLRLGNMRLAHEPGQRLMLSVDGVGAFADPVAASDIVPYCHPGRPVTRLHNYTVGGHVVCIRRFELTVPLEVGLRPCHGAPATAGSHVWPGSVSLGASPTVELQLEPPDLATVNYFEQWRNGAIVENEHFEWVGKPGGERGEVTMDGVASPAGDVICESVSGGVQVHNFVIAFDSTGSLTVDVYSDGLPMVWVVVGIEAGVTTAAQVAEAINSDLIASRFVYARAPYVGDAAASAPASLTGAAGALAHATGEIAGALATGTVICWARESGQAGNGIQYVHAPGPGGTPLSVSVSADRVVTVHYDSTAAPDADDVAAEINATPEAFRLLTALAADAPTAIDAGTVTLAGGVEGDVDGRLRLDLGRVQWHAPQIEYGKPTLITLTGHVSRGHEYDIQFTNGLSP